MITKHYSSVRVLYKNYGKFWYIILIIPLNTVLIIPAPLIIRTANSHSIVFSGDSFL